MYPTDPLPWGDPVDPNDGQSSAENNEENYAQILTDLNGIADTPDTGIEAVPICQYPAGMFLFLTV